jgi:prepilin-type N-terminal cleavage/methylation domain-containing protein
VKAYRQKRSAKKKESKGCSFPEAALASRRGKGTRQRACLAFTLLELLIVITIIGILAAISLPALKGFGESNIIGSANRHLLDDVALARQLAISTRSTVYMVFVPPGANTFVATNPKDQKLADRLAAGQFTTYALFSRRSVGDQPGRDTPRYLTQWKTLPDGVMIAPSKFFIPTNGVPRFAYKLFPYPTAEGKTNLMAYIAFDYQGRLVSPPESEDAIIPLARGSILYTRDSNGRVRDLDVAEVPPGNSIANSNHIRIDWLTGRARVERLEIQ